jgi:hypothetical protein
VGDEKRRRPNRAVVFLLVRPAWAVVRGWKSPRDLVAGTEVNRKASDREDGAEGSGVAKS